MFDLILAHMINSKSVLARGYMPKKHPDVQKYTWRQFEKDVEIIVWTIKTRKLKFSSVWGPPRGGLVLAVKLSHKLDIPLRLVPPKKFSEKILIVDDIADTGKTLKPFYDRGFFIVTLFFKRSQSVVTPRIWRREKRDKWIDFPWEAN